MYSSDAGDSFQDVMRMAVANMKSAMSPKKTGPMDS